MIDMPETKELTVASADFTADYFTLVSNLLQIESQKSSSSGRLRRRNLQS